MQKRWAKKVAQLDEMQRRGFEHVENLREEIARMQAGRGADWPKSRAGN